MSEKLSQRRQVENEVMFRQSNERVVNGLHDLEQIAKSEGYDRLPNKDEFEVHFYCECSDENCRERIVLKPGDYEYLHKNRRQFVVKPNHEVKEIEKVVHATSDYSVVEKHISPPESAEKLQPTDTDNV